MPGHEPLAARGVVTSGIARAVIELGGLRVDLLTMGEHGALTDDNGLSVRPLNSTQSTTPKSSIKPLTPLPFAGNGGWLRLNHAWIRRQKPASKRDGRMAVSPESMQ